jgi:hypothetical protein
VFLPFKKKQGTPQYLTFFSIKKAPFRQPK